MDLTDTWIEFYRWSLREQKRRAKEGADELNCGLCDVAVPMDNDFDVYSSAIEVIENPIDDGPLPEGALPPWFKGVRMVEDRIVCLSCLATRVPELATWVREYRRLRALRHAAIESAH